LFLSVYTQHVQAQVDWVELYGLLRPLLKLFPSNAI